MDNELIILKRLLNSITDKELKEKELWIDNGSGVQAFAIDNNAISIFTTDADLKVNDKQW